MNAATDNGAFNNTGKVDRDIPSLKTRKKRNNITRLMLVGAMLVALMAVATGSAVFMKRLENKKQEEAIAKAKERPKETPPSARDFAAAKRRIKEEELKLPPPSSALISSASATPVAWASGPAPATAGTMSAGNAAAGNARPTGALEGTAAQRRMSGDVLVSLGEAIAPVSIVNNSGVTAGFVAGHDAVSAPKNGFDEKLKPSQLIAGAAAQRPDLTMLLRRGTSIACGQKTRIVTTHPGMVSCVISKDVYSADGKVLLVERGSEAFGEQRTALMQGQASIEVLWSRIETPRGVAIDINSLGTDSLGASGHPAQVDNHIAQRFGGAVMLSLISDFGQALVNRAGEGQGTLRLTTTSTAGQDLATKTLENTINIPPTGYSEQGAAINIFVARDMDFRRVYELAPY